MTLARPGDEAAMRAALDLAAQPPTGPQAGIDVPIAALVLGPGGDIVASATNARAAHDDPTAHAEIVAMRRTAQLLGNWRLDDHTLVVTMEPCPMCAGAARLARVGRVVFGAWNDDYGAAGSVWDVLREGRLPVRVEVVGGVLERDCAQLVKSFFQDRRGGAGITEGV
ncbi:MAG: nucleoside deaminase [Actinomycetes bacterium]